jgi:chemotaxis response regulator CheB
MLISRKNSHDCNRVSWQSKEAQNFYPLISGGIPLRKIIVILEEDQLINAGVQSFLTAQDCFEVIGLENTEPLQIIQEIERIQPDVIIIDQNNQTIPLGELLSHFENTPNIRTIALNISNNQIQICDKRQVQIHQLSDFISVLL